MDDKVDRRAWLDTFKQALEAEGWGDVDDASTHYTNLKNSLKNSLNTSLGVDDKNVIGKLIACLSSRLNAIKEDGKSGLEVREIKTLTKVFEDLYENKPPTTPFPIANLGVQEFDTPAEVINDEDEPPEQKEAEQTLKPTTMQIQIEKIGLKDAQNYIKPCIKISVIDANGRTIDTHTVKSKGNSTPLYIPFEKTVEIKEPIEKILGGRGGSLFFEFIHYKPKKSKLSTRCFAFMEANEIKDNNNQEAALELYKKPVDYAKKKLNLFTVKNLFLHVTVSIMQTQ
jgi:hypothetical protein